MKILLVNQCFYPDLVATAQYTSDLAVALAERGHEVEVIASSRGYDDPSLRFVSHEIWKGVRIHRVPCLATGKGSRRKRILNIASFFVACAARMLLLSRYEVVIALTSPPLISALGALFARVRSSRFIFWIMDLNPDEAIAAGWLRAGSRTAKLLEAVLRYSAHAADRVIVLDRFMRDRMLTKDVAPGKLLILPPWSQDDGVRYDAVGRQSFRNQHGLDAKFVVMYSGNHSPCHPLDTVIEAARALAQDHRIQFCFVGGGSEFPKVQAFAREHELANILCLPYQPRSGLAASLSAADVHLVVMGAKMTGLVHPCKIYNVLTLGIPVIHVGPRESHIGDIAAARVDGAGIRHVLPGDETGLVSAIQRAADRGEARGEIPANYGEFAMDRVVGQFLETIEGLIPLPLNMGATAAAGHGND